MLEKIKQPVPWYILVFLFGIFCWLLAITNNSVIAINKRVETVEAKVNKQDLVFTEIRINMKNIAEAVGVTYYEK